MTDKRQLIATTESLRKANRLGGQKISIQLDQGAAASIELLPAKGGRRIAVVLDKGNLLRWHLWLVESLRARYDVAVSVLAVEGAIRLPAACRVAFELERIIYRLPSGGAVDRLHASEMASLLPTEVDFEDEFDACIDCTGRMRRGGRILTPLFDGAPGEIGALNALLDNRSISIAIEDSERPLEFVTATPGLADRKVLTRAIDNACSIAIKLVIKALERDPLPLTRSAPRPDARASASPACLAFVASSLLWKVNRFLSLQLAGHEQWSVAYRKADGAGLLDERKGEFAFLPDDGRRYFADPFVMRHRGRTALFMEEFPFATMRGRIAVAVIDDDGAVTAPRPAIEQGYHLSYPNVFECDGEIWMVPESGENATVDLYRAVDFPFGWRREATLLQGVAAYDATLMRDSGGWWMFAATRFRRATGWDSLNVYYAPDLRGPWRSCAHNPVVLDASAARPAGAIISRLGARLRPVQDCGTGYGSAIGLWRIDRLHREGLEQTQVARIVSDQFGVHTFNTAEGFEVIDAFGKTRGLRTMTACLREPLVEHSPREETRDHAAVM